MDYLSSGLLWGIMGVMIVFLSVFIKNYLKARKDPDVKTAALLEMSMSVFRDCQEVFNERQKIYQNKTEGINVRMPKNPNAYRRYEQYRFYVKDINEWWMMSKEERSLMSFNNPYEKSEYNWLKDLPLPNIISDETALKMVDDNDREMKENPQKYERWLYGRHNIEDDWPDSYDIGKPFPMQEYIKSGIERTVPIFTENGFNILVSLSNITEEERRTFRSDIIYLSIKDIVGIPFCVLNFNNLFRVDFNLNVLKMNKGLINNWLSNKGKEPEYYIILFLVDSSTTNIIEIRQFLFDDMKYIRKICSSQLHSTKEDIDNLIMMNRAFLSVDDIETKPDRKYEDDNGFNG